MTNTTIDYYYNAGWQVVEERRAVGAGAAQVHTQYLWCPSYIDTPVLRWRDTSEVPNQTLNETLYYTVDANKNVTALIDATPGSSTEGQVVERYLYDPYGRVTVLDNDWNEIAWLASRKNEILFTGYRYNPETGMYQARRREYHPTLGRFMQRDPLGYVDGGNLYAGYFVMWGGVDPMGLNVRGHTFERNTSEICGVLGTRTRNVRACLGVECDGGSGRGYAVERGRCVRPNNLHSHPTPACPPFVPTRPLACCAFAKSPNRHNCHDCCHALTPPGGAHASREFLINCLCKCDKLSDT